MGDPGDLGILLGDSGDSIDHKDNDIRPLDRCDGSHDRETLDIFGHFALPADTGRIDQDIIFSVMGDRRIDRVPGRTGYITDDHTVLPDQTVDQR